jgi:hypothetical protein
MPIQTLEKSDLTCARLADPTIQIRVASMSKLATLREIWLRDLCNLRGNVAHGKIGAQYSPIWSIRNHLLLASHVFPLLLKAFLAQKGSYTLTAGDQFEIDHFELRACEDHFASSKHHPWNAVTNPARMKQIFESTPINQLPPPTASTSTNL